MSFIVATCVFVVSAFALGLFTPYSEEFVGVITWVFTALGLYIAVIMALRRYFYTTSLFAFHVGFTAFVAYIYLNRHAVVPERLFNFSTFTAHNLQLAIWVMCVSTVAILLPWLLLARRTVAISRLSVRAVALETLGRLDSIRPIWAVLLLTGSGLGAFALFLTNPSVIDISYPFQYEAQWVPYEFLKAPTMMSAVALAIVYAKRVIHGRGEALIVNIARANFLFVTVFMLLLTGSRGLFTFLWLMIGFFELFLWWRRRGSMSWGIAFVGLGWFSFQCWPYMRWYLSLLPFNDVFSEALLIFLGYHSSVADVYQAGIRLGEVTMIGASLFHLLYVVQLIHDGISLHGSTFINLIPQFLPSWLDGVLWERPISDGWVLGEYYSHGGGFLIVANAYWNGGTWVAAPFMGILSSVFVGYDRYLASPHAGGIFRFAYWLWLPVMIVQLGYGIEGFVRVIELLAAAIVAEHLFSRRSVLQLRPHPDTP